MMKIAVASDHAGFEYKEQIKSYLEALGHDVEDFGTDSNQPVDYPDFIRPAAQAVAAGRYQLGIVLGGSGNGEAIVANRIKGVRCAVCWNPETAQLARQHNNANMISLGQRQIDWPMAQQIIDAWLAAKFEDGRHRNRIRKIDE